VFLGHLSQENNLKEIAHSTAEEILFKKDTGVNEIYTLHDTDPSEPSLLFNV